jgi:hypothetical protein
MSYRTYQNNLMVWLPAGFRVLTETILRYFLRRTTGRKSTRKDGFSDGEPGTKSTVQCFVDNSFNSERKIHYGVLCCHQSLLGRQPLAIRYT